MLSPLYNFLPEAIRALGFALAIRAGRADCPGLTCAPTLTCRRCPDLTCSTQDKVEVPTGSDSWNWYLLILMVGFLIGISFDRLLKLIWFGVPQITGGEKSVAKLALERNEHQRYTQKCSRDWNRSVCRGQREETVRHTLDSQSCSATTVHLFVSTG